MFVLRIAIILGFSVVCLAENSHTIGWISDHGIAAPHGIGGRGFGFRLSTYERGERLVSAMVESWTPDFWISTGDMSNQRGNRAQTYKGVLVRSANPVIRPVVTTSLLQEHVTGKSEPQTIRVSALTETGYYALNFDAANAEVIRVTSRTSMPPYTITAVFLKNHAVREPVQPNAQTVQVNTTATDCEGTKCLPDLYLFGVNDVFSVGRGLTDITVTSGTATVSIINREKPYKVGDLVTIAGSGVSNLDGSYTITDVPLADRETGANQLTFATKANRGAYKSERMTVSFKRVMYENTYLGIQEDEFKQFESFRVTEVPNATSFVATFAKSHPAGAIIRGSAHVPYLNWIRAGKFVPTMGNHDYNGGEFDWCDNEPECAAGRNMDAYFEYWPTRAGGSWKMQPGKPWHVAKYPLITIFSLDNSRGHAIVGEGTEQHAEMKAAMDACDTQWCVPIMHFGTWGAFLNNRHNTDGAPQPQYQWYGTHPKVDAVLCGHGHHMEHTTIRTNGRPALMNGVGGDSIGVSRPDDKEPDACALVGDCITKWIRASWTTPRSNYGAVKIHVTETRLRFEFYEITDWKIPVYTFELSKRAKR